MKFSKKVVCAVALIVLSVGVWKASEQERKTAAAPVTMHMPSAEEAMDYSELPTGPQGNILSFLERSSFKPWKTLNVRATHVVFNGSNLVSIYRAYGSNSLVVTVRSILDGNILKSFTIPVPASNDKFFEIYSAQAGNGYVWSADGRLIAVMNPDNKNIDVWSTATGTIVKSIPSALFKLEIFDENCRVLGLNNDGTMLFVRMSEKHAIPMPTEEQSDLIPKIKVLQVNTNTVMTLHGSENLERFGYTLSSHAFLAIPEYVAGQGSTLMQWNLKTGVMSTIGHTKRIVGCLFNDDGTMLALTYGSNSYNSPYSVELFNYNFNNSSLSSRCLLASCTFAVFSHDNTFCITESQGQGTIFNDYVINIVDTSGRLLQQLALGDGNLPTLSPDDTVIALPSSSGIELLKQSSSLQDALEKSERVKGLRKKRARDVSRAAARAEEESQTDMSSVD